MDVNKQDNLPFISIVLPTHNRVGSLLRCIEGLQRLDYPKDSFEIIIVDDCSTDNTQEMLAKMMDCARQKIIYLRNERNRGVAASRNRGFSQASGEIIASLDDDCLVTDKWLRKVVATLHDYPQAAAVGGSVVNMSTSGLEWASYLLEFSYWLPYGKVRQVRDIPTCNIAYRRSRILKLSFSEEFKESGFFSDTMFNYSLRCQGGDIIFNPSAEVLHYKCDFPYTEKEFFQEQIRYADNLLAGGFVALGAAGKLSVKYAFLNLLCPRIILIACRCIRSRKYLTHFIANFLYILRGEFTRSKRILEKRNLI